ncbi:MAG TPA: hypothetical protein VGM43_21665 [Bryobacteraceae bacterium]|jgi:hypothetical protein
MELFFVVTGGGVFILSHGWMQGQAALGSMNSGVGSRMGMVGSLAVFFMGSRSLAVAAEASKVRVEFAAVAGFFTAEGIGVTFGVADGADGGVLLEDGFGLAIFFQADAGGFHGEDAMAV